MDTLKNIEKAGRQAWLAGIGAYGTGWKFAVEKFDETYAKTNDFVNDLITEGEKIEKELQEKINAKEIIDEKITELKNKLGLTELSEIERIEQLTAKVDNLTAAVSKLVEARQAKKAPKVATRAKATVKKTVAKAPKVVAKAKAVIKKPVAKAPVASKAVVDMTK